MAVDTVEIRESDNKGRLTLPRGFANSTLLVEVVSDVELRLRKAKVVPLPPSEGPRFVEEEPVVLAGDDRAAFLAALDNPPPPNDALKRLMGGDC